MARRDEEVNEMIVTVPLRRLLTGVPRTKRAAAAIPRIKRFVRRHVKSQWLDAVTTDDDPDGKIWIDDSLNMTIWRRGREHVAGPAEWEEPTGGGPPRLTRRTSVRYGSVLKVRVLFNEDPEDGGDARLELSLPGIDHTTRQSRREARKDTGKKKKAEDEEEDEEDLTASDEEDEEDEEEDEEEAPSAPKPVKESAAKSAAEKKAPSTPKPAKGSAAKSAPKKKKKKAPSTPKPAKGSGAKSAPKKAAKRKEGGD